MAHHHPTLKYTHALPFGAILHDDGVQFSVVSRSATGIRDTVVWKKLYKFQRDGVVGAIDKLQRYGGCILADSVGRPRFLVGLLVFFAGATILLAGVGLYGLLAFNVGRRTREIGVRVALGAPQGRVRTMVVGEGLRLAAAGLVLGLVLSLWGGGFLASLLFGVDARDPAILAGAAAGLFVVSAAAASLPARRATAIRPQEALGVE